MGKMRGKQLTGDCTFCRTLKIHEDLLYRWFGGKDTQGIPCREGNNKGREATDSIVTATSWCSPLCLERRILIRAGSKEEGQLTAPHSEEGASDPRFPCGSGSGSQTDPSLNPDFANP